MLNTLLLRLTMKINDEDNYILFCKRAFYGFWEGLASKTFSGGKPQTPILQWGSSEKDFFGIYFLSH